MKRRIWTSKQKAQIVLEGLSPENRHQPPLSKVPGLTDPVLQMARCLPSELPPVL